MYLSQRLPFCHTFCKYQCECRTRDHHHYKHGVHHSYPETSTSLRSYPCARVSPVIESQPCKKRNGTEPCFCHTQPYLVFLNTNHSSKIPTFEKFNPFSLLTSTWNQKLCAKDHVATNFLYVLTQLVSTAGKYTLVEGTYD